jgi:hypothetical protein
VRENGGGGWGVSVLGGVGWGGVGWGGVGGRPACNDEKKQKNSNACRQPTIGHVDRTLVRVRALLPQHQGQGIPPEDEAACALVLVLWGET